MDIICLEDKRYLYDVVCHKTDVAQTGYPLQGQLPNGQHN